METKKLLRRGTVKVNVLRAENLRNVVVLFGSQDPFVQTFLTPGPQSKANSPVVEDGGVDPVWKTHKPMRLQYPGWDGTSSAPRLHFDVYDEETLVGHRLIGSGTLLVAEVARSIQENTSKEFKVELCDNSKASAGTLYVSISIEWWPEIAQCGTFDIRCIESSLNTRQHAAIDETETKVESSAIEAEHELIALKNKVAKQFHTKARFLRVTGFPGRDSQVLALDEPSKDALSPVVQVWYPGADVASAAQGGIGVGLQVELLEKRHIVGSRVLATGWLDWKIAVLDSFKDDEFENNGKETIKDWIRPIDLIEPTGESAGSVSLKLVFHPLYDYRISKTVAWGSQPSSNRRQRALFIGINYLGSKAELNGCVNDARQMVQLIVNRYRCPLENIRVLVDSNKESFPPGIQISDPTSDNIRKAFLWLVGSCSSGDLLYLHYSGHGSQVDDDNGDEADGMDETLLPMDFDFSKRSTLITDDEIRNSLFQQVAPGVQLTVTFDCCNSGTMSDLKQVQVGRENRSSSIPLGNNTKDRFFPPTEEILERIRAFKTSNNSGGWLGKMANQVSKRLMSIQRAKALPIVVISGCRDDQTSADVTVDGKPQGAMTWSLIQVLSENPSDPHPTLEQLVTKIREKIKSKGWTQVPQLSMGNLGTKIEPVWLADWPSSSGKVDTQFDDHTLGNGSGDQCLPALDTSVVESDQSTSQLVAPIVDEYITLSPVSIPTVPVDFSSTHFCDAITASTSHELVPSELPKEKSNIDDTLTAMFDHGIAQDQTVPEQECRAPGHKLAMNSTILNAKAHRQPLHNSYAGNVLFRPKIPHAPQARKSQVSRTRLSASKKQSISYRHSKGSEESECTFKPQISKKSKALLAAAGVGRSSNFDGFLGRMQARVRSHEDALQRKRGEQEYNCKVDKKSCPKCKCVQSYDEVVHRKSRCSTCNLRYR